MYWLELHGDEIRHSSDTFHVSNGLRDKVLDAMELAAKAYGVKALKIEDQKDNDPPALTRAERVFWASRNYKWQPGLKIEGRGNHPGEVPGYWVKKL